MQTSDRSVTARQRKFSWLKHDLHNLRRRKSNHRRASWRSINDVDNYDGQGQKHYRNTRWPSDASTHRDRAWSFAWPCTLDAGFVRRSSRDDWGDADIIRGASATYSTTERTSRYAAASRVSCATWSYAAWRRRATIGDTKSRIPSSANGAGGSTYADHDAATDAGADANANNADADADANANSADANVARVCYAYG